MPADPNLKGFRVYRTQGRYDGDYTKLADLPVLPRGRTTMSPQSAGRHYYYYLVVVGDPALNTGEGLTPAGVALTSSRYYTQTYDPAYLQAPGRRSGHDQRPGDRTARPSGR